MPRVAVQHIQPGDSIVRRNVDDEVLFHNTVVRSERRFNEPNRWYLRLYTSYAFPGEAREIGPRTCTFPMGTLVEVVLGDHRA